MAKRVVHFEIGCNDIPKTSEFYANVFGWELILNGNSAIITSGNEGGISGHINKLGPEELQNYVTIYIETDSLEHDLLLVKLNNGKIIVEPIQLPDGRTFAWIEDVAGNTIGLITPSPK